MIALDHAYDPRGLGRVEQRFPEQVAASRATLCADQHDEVLRTCTRVLALYLRLHDVLFPR